MIDFISSYRLTDFILFSQEVYSSVLVSYNHEIWPAQIIAILISIFILYLIRRAGAHHARIVWLLIASLWIFVGWKFHLQTYTQINWAAKYFAWWFFAEAFLLCTLAIAGKLQFNSKRGRVQKAGIVIFAVAAFLPVELLLGTEASAISLFGWGAEMTAWGTMGLLFVGRDISKCCGSWS